MIAAPRRQTHPLRRWVAVVLASVVAIGAFTALGWGPYVRPQVDTPRKVDAIVVLGGAHDGREQTGLRLASQGFAPRVVFSNPYGNSPYMRNLCTARYQFEVSCFVPDPSTTRGEAQEIARMASAGGWTSIIVVTFTPHISRSRYIFDKCWGGDVLMVNSPTTLPTSAWAWNYVYQTAGFIRSFIEGC